MRQLATERVEHWFNDRPAASMLPIVPADASPALAEGLRRRRVVAVLGRCPCGARRPAPTALQHAAAGAGVAHVPVPHKPDCPAHNDLLGPAVAAWSSKAA